MQLQISLLFSKEEIDRKFIVPKYRPLYEHPWSIHFEFFGAVFSVMEEFFHCRYGEEERRYIFAGPAGDDSMGMFFRIDHETENTLHLRPIINQAATSLFEYLEAIRAIEAGHILVSEEEANFLWARPDKHHCVCNGDTRSLNCLAGYDCMHHGSESDCDHPSVLLEGVEYQILSLYEAYRRVFAIASPSDLPENPAIPTFVVLEMDESGQPIHRIEGPYLSSLIFAAFTGSYRGEELAEMTDLVFEDQIPLEEDIEGECECWCCGDMAEPGEDHCKACLLQEPILLVIDDEVYLLIFGQNPEDPIVIRTTDGIVMPDSDLERMILSVAEQVGAISKNDDGEEDDDDLGDPIYQIESESLPTCIDQTHVRVALIDEEGTKETWIRLNLWLYLGKLYAEMVMAHVMDSVRAEDAEQQPDVQIFHVTGDQEIYTIVDPDDPVVAMFTDLITAMAITPLIEPDAEAGVINPSPQEAQITTWSFLAPHAGLKESHLLERISSSTPPHSPAAMLGFYFSFKMILTSEKQ